MAQLSARQVALKALRAWQKKSVFADSIIGTLLAGTNLTASDRGFALELFYGVLRNLTLLDFWIDQLRRAKVDADCRDILRLGLYQLFLLDLAGHAAVYETVQLAPKQQRGFINGMLRSAQRQRAELHSLADAQPLSVRVSHPNFLVDRWNANFGAANAASLSAWNNRPPPVYGRINGLKITRDDFLARYPESRPTDSRSGFVVLSSLPSDALACGHCYIQDPSTAIACELLDPKPAENILDACAAPGGKTSYLAELMQNRGTIVACDRDPKRLQILEGNLKRLGVTMVRSFCSNWSGNEVANDVLLLAPFDRILVDVPCSNTGVIRRRVDVRWRLRSGEFERMQAAQLAIVRAVVPLLKPNGVLVYSTCSLEPEEDEDVVRELEKEMPILRCEDMKSSVPFRDGFDGAFVAKFRKSN